MSTWPVKDWTSGFDPTNKRLQVNVSLNRPFQHCVQLVLVHVRAQLCLVVGSFSHQGPLSTLVFPHVRQNNGDF